MEDRCIELLSTDSSRLLIEDDVINERQINAPADLDRFFKDVYEYHAHKGILGLFLTPLYQLVLHTFVIAISGIAIGCVDWYKLSLVEEDTALSEFLVCGRLTNGAPAIIASLYIIVTSCYLIWRCGCLFLSAQRWWNIHLFYKEDLKITSVMETTWPYVVSKLIEIQDSGYRLMMSKDRLLPVDVAIRVLRLENFMVAVVQNNILQCTRLDDVIQWNIWWTLLGPMFPEHSWKMQLDITSFRQRCQMLLLLNVMLMPITLTLRIAYLILKSAEIAASPSSSLKIRQWSPKAQWVAREYNEYPYVIEGRLRKSSILATEYLLLYPSTSSRRACSLIKFLCGSVVGCITVLAAFQDEALTHIHVYDRNLLWWLGCFSGIFAVANAVQPPFCRYSPKDLDTSLNKLKKQMKYHPQEWGQQHHKHVQKDLESMYPYFFVEWAQSIYSLLCMPYILYKWSRRAEEIVHFIRGKTTHSTYHGDICLDSLMEDVPNPDDYKAANSYSSFHEEFEANVSSACINEIV